MDANVRRRALRAAARLAVPATLLGCASTVGAFDPPANTPRDASGDNATAADVAVAYVDVAPAVDTPATPPRCGLGDPAALTEAQVPCCESEVLAAFSPDGGANGGPTVGTAPTTLACCQGLITYFDTHQGPTMNLRENYEALFACCEAVAPRESRTCTPWGPPVPPSFERTTSASAALRAVPPLVDLRAAAGAWVPVLPDVPHLYRAAQATWRGRMVNEYESAEVFAALARQFARAGLSHEWVETCRAFADEERKHGVLCGAVVTALGGEAVAPGTAREAFPDHADASDLEGVIRNVLSVCCLSETVAVALIGAERLEMPDGALRDLLTTIWADEVGHARFGWRLLTALAAQLDAGARARLGAYLRVAFDHLETHELAHLPLATPPAEGVALGLCQGADARTLFFETVTEVIIPALESVGLPGRQAWAERHLAAA